MSNQFRKYYTDEQIIENSKNVLSMAALLRSLDLVPVGGNYRTMTRKIALLNVDTSHWTKQLWSKGRSLKAYADYKKPKSLKARLIKERSHACEQCRNSLWNNLPIPLEIHHINGISIDNEVTNLQLLCANCHAQTPNWRNRKR